MSDATHGDLRAALERVIGVLQAKKHAIDQAIAGVRLLQGQVDVIGAELAESLARGIVQRYTQSSTPSLFDNTEEDDPAVQRYQFVLANPPYTGNHRERVISYFLDRGNEPATNLEIRNAVGLSRGAVAVVVYTFQGKVFEKADEGNARSPKMRWHLKPDVYERMQREREGDKRTTKRATAKKPPD